MLRTECNLCSLSSFSCFQFKHGQWEWWGVPSSQPGSPLTSTQTQLSKPQGKIDIALHWNFRLVYALNINWCRTYFENIFTQKLLVNLTKNYKKMASKVLNYTWNLKTEISFLFFISFFNLEKIFLQLICFTVKPKCIQTPSTFLTLSQFICYSLENGNKMTRTQSEALNTLHGFRLSQSCNQR